MSEANHTPGPWHVYESFRADKVSVLADVDLPHGRRAVTRTVAECGYPGAETKANAELIASAPETKAQRDELFNAALGAEQIIADFIGVYGDSGAGEVLAELRAAIRRAQGGGDE